MLQVEGLRDVQILGLGRRARWPVTTPCLAAAVMASRWPWVPTARAVSPLTAGPPSMAAVLTAILLLRDPTSWAAQASALLLDHLAVWKHHMDAVLMERRQLWGLERRDVIHSSLWIGVRTPFMVAVRMVALWLRAPTRRAVTPSWVAVLAHAMAVVLMARNLLMGTHTKAVMMSSSLWPAGIHCMAAVLMAPLRL